MRKILILFNGVGYPTHVMNFAVKLSTNGAASLHAVFMKPAHVDDSLQYPFPNDLSIAQDLIDKGGQERTDMQAVEDNKQVFRDECQLNNIPFKVDDEMEVSLGGLTEHSKFSDLIIADVNNELGKYSIEDLLAKSQCPVILVQRQTDMPVRVILTYDGTASSIHAIKMYSYLFPEWKNVHTLFVQVNPEDPGEFTKNNYVESWLNQHFSKLDISILKGNVESELSALLNTDSERTMMVMGAYGKKGLAGFFHQSLANKMIAASHVSLFIAHQ